MTAAAQARRKRTAGRRPALTLAFVLVLLAGCGRARLSQEVTAPAAGPPPTRLLVMTDTRPAIAGGVDPSLATRTATTLTRTVVEGLQQNGIPAEIATTGGAATDAARLSLALRRVEEGSRLQRNVIGFGRGQSRIEVTARLHPAGATAVPQGLLAFQGAAHSGYRPGLVASAGAGLAAQGAMAVVGAAGVGIAEARGRGPDKDLRDLAEAVVERTVAYYRSAGWAPQAAPPALDEESAVAARAAEAPRR